MQEQPLCTAIAGKVREQMELAESLIAKLSAEQLAWTPPGEAWSTARLLGHLLDCLAGMCAALYAAKPEDLAHFGTLRALPVNHACGRDEALARIREYQARIAEGFSRLTDPDLARPIPTVFVANGEPLLTLILGNLEHLTNHKHELFVRLKRMGAAVGTPDLYRFRA